MVLAHLLWTDELIVESTSNLTPKMLVAMELLGKALESYFDGANFAAIHLAGAAEEILGTYVTRIGKETGAENAFTSMRNLAAYLSEPVNGQEEKAAQKEISVLMNSPRNRTKHLNGEGDDDILFDPRTEAKDLLNRAVSDYNHLMNYLPLPDTELLRRFIELQDELL